MSGTDAVFNDKSWTDAEGKYWKLEDMDPLHRHNVLRFVRDRALVYFAAHSIREELFDPYEPKETYVTEEQMTGFLPIELQLGRHKELDAKEWLEETPLVKRLVELEP
jgi:hypothetical protein